jgi:hypothetical protein
MTNLIKKLWNDTQNLTKAQFLGKYLLPMVAIFFTWGMVGQILFISIYPNLPNKIAGKVTSIAVQFEQGTERQYKYYPLKIGLAKHPQEFRLPEIYKSDFPSLLETIKIGDTITLHSGYKWQTILFWGEQTDIYQIDKNGKTLFGISKIKAIKKSDIKTFGFLSAIFWIWYIVYRDSYRRTRKVK